MIPSNLETSHYVGFQIIIPLEGRGNHPVTFDLVTSTSDSEQAFIVSFKSLYELRAYIEKLVALPLLIQLKDSLTALDDKIEEIID